MLFPAMFAPANTRPRAARGWKTTLMAAALALVMDLTPAAAIHHDRVMPVEADAAPQGGVELSMDVADCAAPSGELTLAEGFDAKGFLASLDTGPTADLASLFGPGVDAAMLAPPAPFGAVELVGLGGYAPADFALM